MTRAVKRRNFEEEIIALECRVAALEVVAREANLALVHAGAVLEALHDTDAPLADAANHVRAVQHRLKGVLGR